MVGCIEFNFSLRRILIWELGFVFLIEVFPETGSDKGDELLLEIQLGGFEIWLWRECYRTVVCNLDLCWTAGKKKWTLMDFCFKMDNWDEWQGRRALVFEVKNLCMLLVSLHISGTVNVGIHIRRGHWSGNRWSLNVIETEDGCSDVNCIYEWICCSGWVM